MSSRYIVAWDFPRKPSGTFYRVLSQEFGSSHTQGDYTFETQTKKLPFRQGYGLNDKIDIQVTGWADKGKTVTAWVTRIRSHLADVRLELPQTQFRHHCPEGFALGFCKNLAAGFAQDHGHFGFGRKLAAGMQLQDRLANGSDGLAFTLSCSGVLVGLETSDQRLPQLRAVLYDVRHLNIQPA